MSEGHSGDIHTIRNIMIFFVVMFVIAIVVSIGTTVYALVQSGFFEGDESAPPPPPAPGTRSTP